MPSLPSGWAGPGPWGRERFETLWPQRASCSRGHPCRQLDSGRHLCGCSLRPAPRSPRGHPMPEPQSSVRPSRGHRPEGSVCAPGRPLEGSAPAVQGGRFPGTPALQRLQGTGPAAPRGPRRGADLHSLFLNLGSEVWIQQTDSGNTEWHRVSRSSLPVACVRYPASRSVSVCSALAHDGFKLTTRVFWPLVFGNNEVTICLVPKEKQ